MSRFLIGQVCDALGVKAHVLRYWERHVDLLSPAKDRSGRRVYTLRDVQLLFRLKYLIQSRKMTLEGASQKLLEEVQGGGQNRKAAIDALRGDLFRASLGSRRLRMRLEESMGDLTQLEGGTIPGTAMLRSRLTTPARLELEAELEELAREPAATLVGLLRGKLAGAEGPSSRDLGTDTAAPPSEDDIVAAEAALHSAPLRVVTPTPAVGQARGQAAGSRETRGRTAPGSANHETTAHESEARTYPGLLPLFGRRSETVIDRIGDRLSKLAAETGHAPQWTIHAPRAVCAELRRRLALRQYYGLPSENLRVVEEPRLPLLSADGRVVVDASGTVPRYSVPFLTALHSLAQTDTGSSEGSGPESLQTDRTPSFGLILPVTNALPRLPDVHFLAVAIASETSVAAKVMRMGERLLPTGELLVSLERAGELVARLRLFVRRVAVMSFGSSDDILETEAMRAEVGIAAILEAAAGGALFEVDPAEDIALLRSLADWETC
jgi:DNA-binding transcriptional MerR regulator